MRRRSRCRIVTQERQRGVTIDRREQTDDGGVIRQQGLAKLRLDHDLGLDCLATMTHDLAEFGVQI